MEKTPSSVSMGRRRGEIRWMPEKARACNESSGAEAVPDGFWVAVVCAAQPGMAVPLVRRPQS